MNCDFHYATFREIEKLRDVCLKCKVCAKSNTMQAGGRGVVFADGAETDNGESADIDYVIAHSVGKNHHAPEVYAKDQRQKPITLTKLPVRVEDKLRDVLAGLVDLKPQEMLLLWHFAHGGNLANFRDTAAEFMERMAYWKDRDKRAVFHVWKTITRKMPFLDALFVRGNERRAISKHRMN